MKNQMRIIHNINYDVTAQLEFRKIIYQNIIRGMKVMTTMVMMMLVMDFQVESIAVSLFPQIQITVR